MRITSALSSTSALVAPRWITPPPIGALLGISAHFRHQIVLNLRLNRFGALNIDLFDVRFQVGDLFGRDQPAACCARASSTQMRRQTRRLLTSLQIARMAGEP